jgi:hypothetical protein
MLRFVLSPRQIKIVIAMATLEESLCLLRVAAKILGIFPFKVQNRKLVFSKVGLFQIIIYATVFIILAAHSHHFNTLSGNASKSETISLGHNIRRFGKIIVMVADFAIAFTYRSEVLAQIKAISRVDSKLVNFDQRQNIILCNKYTRKALILMFILVCVAYPTVGVLLSALSGTSFDAVGHIAILYLQVVTESFTVTFFVTAMILETRFKIVNGIFLKKVCPYNPNFCKKVKCLTNIHKNLIRISGTVNEVFAVHLLLVITMSCFTLVVRVYSLVHAVIWDSVEELNNSMVSSLTSLTKTVFDLIMIARCSSKLCAEVSNV